MKAGEKMKKKNIKPLLDDKLNEIEKIKEKRDTGLIPENDAQEKIQQLQNEHTLIIIDHVLSD